VSERSSLAWRCRRGTRELDLLLTTYLERAYDSALPAEQAQFAALVQLSDAELARLLFNPLPSDGDDRLRLVSKIRAYLSL